MIAWRLEALRVRYPTGRLGRPGPLVLDGAELRVNAGERVAIIGTSGAGKSTLVRAGLGLLPIESGLVELFGEPLRPPRRTSAGARAQLLLQDPRAMLHPHLPIGMLLRESASLHRPGVDARREAARMLEAVGLAGREEALPHELSGGERRRAGLARVLLARPRLLVADEPTDGLDAQSRVEMLELMRDQTDPECAIVMVSHDLEAVARATDRVLVLRSGRITHSLPSAELDDRWDLLEGTASPALEEGP